MKPGFVASFLAQFPPYTALFNFAKGSRLKLSSSMVKQRKIFWKSGYHSACHNKK
jgi:hypothetical protein